MTSQFIRREYPQCLSGWAQIKLRGWFKPNLAAAIARKGKGFTITPMDGKLTGNGQQVTAKRDLVSGDLIEVQGLTLEFTLS